MKKLEWMTTTITLFKQISVWVCWKEKQFFKIMRFLALKITEGIRLGNQGTQEAAEFLGFLRISRCGRKTISGKHHSFSSSIPNKTKSPKNSLKSKIKIYLNREKGPFKLDLVFDKKDAFYFLEPGQKSGDGTNVDAKHHVKRFYDVFFSAFLAQNVLHFAQRTGNDFGFQANAFQTESRVNVPDCHVGVESISFEKGSLQNCVDVLDVFFQKKLDEP